MNFGGLCSAILGAVWLVQFFFNLQSKWLYNHMNRMIYMVLAVICLHDKKTTKITQTPVQFCAVGFLKIVQLMCFAVFWTLFGQCSFANRSMRKRGQKICPSRGQTTSPYLISIKKFLSRLGPSICSPYRDCENRCTGIENESIEIKCLKIKTLSRSEYSLYI